MTNRLIYRAASELFVLLMLCPVLVSAQSDEYRLSAPTLEEYLTLMPDFPWPEVEYRYGAILGEAPSELLYPALNAFINRNSYLSEWDVWWQAVVFNWILENDVDLNAQRHIQILANELPYNPAYSIEIRPVDFNGDWAAYLSPPPEGSTSEYILDVTSELYLGYIIVGVTDSEYRLVETPLPVSGGALGLRDFRNFRPESLSIGDYNRNGLPEWAVTTACFRADGRQWGNLFLLEWRNEQMVNIIPNEYDPSGETTFFAEPYSYGINNNWDCAPIDVQWEFINIDNDNATEVHQRQRFQDNLDCDLLEIKIFDWNPIRELYEFTRTEAHLAESAGCALRSAQEYMWRQDYEAAIPILENSLHLFSDRNDLTEWEESRAAYAGLQLALAYSMTGDIEHAETIVSELKPPEAWLQPIAELVEQVKQIDVSDAALFCQTMYDAFVEYTNNVAPRGFDTYWGTITNLYDFGIGPGTLDPARAGCPVPGHSSPIVMWGSGPSPDDIVDSSVVAPPTILNVIRFFENESYDEALAEATAFIEAWDDPNRPELQEAYYWRALLYEALDNPDAALDDYIRVMTIAPNTTWGQLAALHLEPVTDDE